MSNLYPQWDDHRKDALHALRRMDNKRREIEDQICSISCPEEGAIADCQDKAEDMLLALNRLLGKLRILKDMDE